MTSLARQEGFQTTAAPQSACWPSVVGKLDLGWQVLLREGVSLAFRDFLMIHFVENLSKQKTRLTWKVENMQTKCGLGMELKAGALT